MPIFKTARKGKEKKNSMEQIELGMFVFSVLFNAQFVVEVALSLCIPFFPLPSALYGGTYLCVCVTCACVCMQAECTTCNVLLHSSVNVLVWLQRYLLYSYYFYYCGCLVMPDIITAVMLFKCIEEQCS
uniref:Uncharacterized protein n=1 Tax=Rhipicephalus zambeziensis TaxID=60191 RepID=A0A224YLE9_9ACAR